jgi:hypothetical protein
MVEPFDVVLFLVLGEESIGAGVVAGGMPSILGAGSNGAIGIGIAGGTLLD